MCTYSLRGEREREREKKERRRERERGYSEASPRKRQQPLAATYSTGIVVSGEIQSLASGSVLGRCGKVEGDAIVHARPEGDGADPA